MGNEKDNNSGFGLGSLFKGLGDLVDLVQNMSEEGKDTFSKNGNFSGQYHDKDIKGKYGFSVHLGTGGEGQIKKFHNYNLEKEDYKLDSVLEPIVDVYDEEDILIVVAEVPGAVDDCINTSLQARELTLDIQGPQRKYWKRINLPVDVEATPVTSTYKNGILELKFKKLAG